MTFVLYLLSSILVFSFRAQRADATTLLKGIVLNVLKEFLLYVLLQEKGVVFLFAINT